MDSRPLQERFQSDPQGVAVPPTSEKVLDYIQRTFNDILDEIKVRPCGKPVITLKRITAVKPYYDDSDSIRLKWRIEDREVSYSFPGKTKDEAWRFGKEKTVDCGML